MSTCETNALVARMFAYCFVIIYFYCAFFRVFFTKDQVLPALGFHELSRLQRYKSFFAGFWILFVCTSVEPQKP